MKCFKSLGELTNAHKFWFHSPVWSAMQVEVKKQNDLLPPVSSCSAHRMLMLPYRHIRLFQNVTYGSFSKTLLFSIKGSEKVQFTETHQLGTVSLDDFKCSVCLLKLHTGEHDLTHSVSRRNCCPLQICTRERLYFQSTLLATITFLLYVEVRSSSTVGEPFRAKFDRDQAGDICWVTVIRQMIRLPDKDK